MSKYEKLLRGGGGGGGGGGAGGGGTALTRAVPGERNKKHEKGLCSEFYGIHFDP